MLLFGLVFIGGKDGCNSQDTKKLQGSPNNEEKIIKH